MKNKTHFLATVAVDGFFIGLAIGLHLPGLVRAATVVNACEVTSCSTISTQQEAPTVSNSAVIGKASYYSRKGCLGCSSDFTMANGQKLDDNKITVAYNKGKLNRRIKITNLRLQTQTVATVTDRGGFERHGKIVDLSVATKNALQCESTCSVKIEEL